jgi:hypothetical protein
MPRVVNKIIINGLVFDGYSQAIGKVFEGMRIVGKEAQDSELLEEFDPERDALEQACKKLDDACHEFLSDGRKILDDMRHRYDELTSSKPKAPKP